MGHLSGHFLLNWHGKKGLQEKKRTNKECKFESEHLIATFAEEQRSGWRSVKNIVHLACNNLLEQKKIEMEQHDQQDAKKDAQERSGNTAQRDREQRESDHVEEQLPPEEIGNVTAGFSEVPDREEEGTCEDKETRPKEKDGEKRE